MREIVHLQAGQCGTKLGARSSGKYISLCLFNDTHFGKTYNRTITSNVDKLNVILGQGFCREGWERGGGGGGRKDFRISPPNERSKEVFFLWDLYIEKWGMVVWGESNIEEFFFYYGGNIPFIYYLLTNLLFLPCIITHSIIFITDYELTLCRFEPKRTVWFGLCVVTDCLTN